MCAQEEGKVLLKLTHLYWKNGKRSQAAKEKSKRAKKNRRCGDLNALAESTHIGGSRSFLESAKLLGMDKAETFAWAHTKEHDKTNYINKRTTNVAKEMHAVEEELTQQGATNYNKDEVLLDVLGGHDKKNRITSLGELAKTVRRDRTTYGSDGRTLEIDERFAHIDDRIAQMDGRIEQIDGRIEHVDGRMSIVEINQQRILDQNHSILDQLKWLRANMGRRGPDPGDSGAGIF